MPGSTISGYLQDHDNSYYNGLNGALSLVDDWLDASLSRNIQILMLVTFSFDTQLQHMPNTLW